MFQVIGQVWREVVGCRNWLVMRVPHFIALRRNVVVKMFHTILHHDDVSLHLVMINSLVPGRFQRNFQIRNFPTNFGISFESVFLWMSLYLIDDKSTLVQVMAWCRPATSHYLSQCWPRSLPPYGVTRPQWVNYLAMVRCKFNMMSYFFLLNWYD